MPSPAPSVVSIPIMSAVVATAAARCRASALTARPRMPATPIVHTTGFPTSVAGARLGSVRAPAATTAKATPAMAPMMSPAREADLTRSAIAAATSTATTTPARTPSVPAPTAPAGDGATDDASRTSPVPIPTRAE